MAKASAAQMKLLSELRAKELKDLSPAEYAMVEREVSANGFQDLKGTAAQIVFNAIRKRDKEMKKAIVEKHGSHDQRSHGAWSSGGKGKYNTDDSEGEDSSEPKNYKDKAPKISYNSNDTEGEFGDNTDDPKWMDEMDVLRPPKRTPGEKAPFGGINFAATWRRTQK